MIKLNGEVVVFKNFPNGETLIDASQIYVNIVFNRIEFKYENDGDLIKLMLLKNHIDNIVDTQSMSELIIAYMPYSRMDRSEALSVFTLKYISNFINQMRFDNVIILEPHSDVTMALINRSVAEFPIIEITLNLMNDINFDKEEDYLLFPDTGAFKRYSKMFEGCKYLIGNKVRDFKTGKISKLDILGDIIGEPKVIIVDDLCSGGYTFYLSVKRLEEVGVKEVHLVVTHCEEKVYDGMLLKQSILKSINTTNSIITESKHEKIKILDII